MEVYPLIVTAQWANRDQCAHRVLVPHEHKISPLLVFGMLTDGRPQYLTTKGMKKHRLRPDSLELDALERMRFRKERAGWQPSAGADGVVRYYQKDGDCLTASEIADQRTMKDIQALMGEERIFVAVPVQECLYVGADRRQIELLCRKRLAQAVKRGETPLAPQVYEMRDGQIVKLYTADASSRKRRAKSPGTRHGKRLTLTGTSNAGTASGSGALKRTGSSARLLGGASGSARSTRTHVRKPTPVGAATGKAATKTRTLAAMSASAAGTGTFTRLSRSVAPSVPALKLPPKLWRIVLCLHVMAGYCLLLSLGGIVLIVRGALQEGNMGAGLIALFVVLPLLWVVAWACWHCVSYLKLGSPMAYRAACGLVGLSCLGLLLPLGVFGFTGLLDDDTKSFCGIGLWENA